MTQDEHESLKKNSNVVITNKVIAFWSRVLQISNICDIGKYVEIKINKIGFWTLIFFAIFGFTLYYFISKDVYILSFLSLFNDDVLLQYYYELSSKEKQNLAIALSYGPFFIVIIWFLLERIRKKEYYFRISMSGGQIHYISSNNEKFIDELMKTTVFAMENSSTPITFVGNIDNSSVIEGSNIVINSEIRDSFVRN